MNYITYVMYITVLRFDISGYFQKFVCAVVLTETSKRFYPSLGTLAFGCTGCALAAPSSDLLIVR